MIAASAVQPILAMSNEAERPLVSIFINEQNGKIYAMDDEVLAIRQWSGDSLVVLTLSVFLAFLFLAFFLWVGLTAGISEYKRRKKRVSNRIARKSLAFHASADPTTSMLRLAKAFIVASTIDFYEYLLLELRFNRAAEKQNMSIEDVGSAGALWNRNVKRIERILIYITIAIFPSLPTLIVCWSYLQILHTKVYVYQPMDDYVERIAYWGLVLATATVLNDISSLLLSRTGTSWGTLGGICSSDRWNHPLRVLGTSVQIFIRMACYCASLLVVANVGIWVLIGVLINPEIAIPVATAISATIAHVVKLQRKFQSLFDRIEAVMQPLGSSAIKKVDCGKDFFKALDAQYAGAEEYAAELVKLKQNLEVGEEKITALSKIIVTPPRAEEGTMPDLSNEVADIASMLSKCELQMVDFPPEVTDKRAYYAEVLTKMVEQGQKSSINVKRAMEAVKDMLKVSAVSDHEVPRLGKWDGKDVMIDNGPKIDISGIVNIAIKPFCENVPLDKSLILHSLAQASTKLISLRIKEVIHELEEKVLLKMKPPKLEKIEKENSGEQKNKGEETVETKEDTGDSEELKIAISEVIEICEKHGLKQDTFINSKQIIALSGLLLNYENKVKKLQKVPKEIEVKHAIGAFKTLSEVHESLSSTDLLTAEIVGEEYDKVFRAFGLSRFQATLQVVYSVVLLVLIFVLIFYAQRAFGFVGVTSGIITSLLCTGSTAAFNHLAVQNLVENQSKECERGGKIFEAVQESPRLPPGTLVPAVVVSTPTPAPQVATDPIRPVINPKSMDGKIMKEEYNHLHSKYKKSILLRTKMSAHLLLLTERVKNQNEAIKAEQKKHMGCDKKLKDKDKIIEDLKKKHKQDITTMTTNHEKEIREEQKKHMGCDKKLKDKDKIIEDLKKKHKQDITTMTTNHEKEIREEQKKHMGCDKKLKDKDKIIEDLKKKHKQDITTMTTNHEKEIREEQKKHMGCDKKLKDKDKIIEDLKKKHKQDITTMTTNHEKEIREEQKKHMGCDKKLKDKDKIIEDLKKKHEQEIKQLKEKLQPGSNGKQSVQNTRCFTRNTSIVNSGLKI